MPNYPFVTREACPVCDGAPEPLTSIGYADQPMLGYLEWRYGQDSTAIAGASYRVACCTRCTLLFQVEVGGAAFLDELYTSWVEEPDDPDQYPAYKRDLADMAASRDAHELLTAAAFLGLEPKRMKTLDYGMGWALWARIAQWLGCESWGFDLSDVRLRFAESHGIRPATLDPAREVGFHFINCEQVFEHLVEPGEEAERLARLLAPGGILKVSVPSAERFDPACVREWLASRNRDRLMPLQPLEHVNGFTRRAIDALARRLNLRPVRPSLLQRYAFLRFPGAIRPSQPRQALKELARPIVQYRRPSNLYVWLRKDRD